MLIDVSRDVEGVSTVAEWSKGHYASAPDSFVLNTDHIVHMEDIKLKTHPNTVITLSDTRVVILVGSVADLKKKLRIQ